MAVVAGAAGGVYAYDKGRADTIAKGVTVDGIALAGLTAAQAHAKLDRLIVQPLERPIVVHHDRPDVVAGRRARRGSRVDVDTIVDEAVQRSREGNILARTVAQRHRQALDADVKPSVTYSDAGDRPAARQDPQRRSTARPVDATREARRPRASARPTAATGLAVRASALHRQIRSAIVSTTADRTFIARTTKLRAEGHDRGPRADVRHGDRRRTATPSGSRSTRTSRSRKTYSIAVGQVGPRDARRALPHPEQGREPGLARPEQRVGGQAWPARSIPAARPTTRSRPAGWASSTAPASTAPTTIGSIGTPPRTAASACAIPDVDRALRPRCRSARRSTSPS